MARPLGYDPADVRRKALLAFWNTGYAETSLDMLEQATGLNRRQLYNGLGDKRAMFLGALDDFNDVAGQRFLAPLEAPGAGPEAIANLLHGFVALSQMPDGKAGCLMCNTSREDIARDADVSPRIHAYFDRIKAAYENALPPAHKDRAAGLLATHVAVCVLGRAGSDPDLLTAMVNDALRDLS